MLTSHNGLEVDPQQSYQNHHLLPEAHSSVPQTLANLAQYCLEAPLGNVLHRIWPALNPFDMEADLFAKPLTCRIFHLFRFLPFISSSLSQFHSSTCHTSPSFKVHAFNFLKREFEVKTPSEIAFFVGLSPNPQSPAMVVNARLRTKLSCRGPMCDTRLFPPFPPFSFFLFWKGTKDE